HPNVVQIYEVGEADGLPFFSLEYCGGGSLDKKFDGTPLPPGEAARLVETLAPAMDAAHEAGIVHRDLKPGNILLQRKSQDPRPKTQEASGGAGGDLRFGIWNFEPKVTDFGLAKYLDRQKWQTQSGSILGTPSYMAPEQATGKGREVGPAADTYALGAILY